MIMLQCNINRPHKMRKDNRAKAIVTASRKKRRHKAGVKLLRQVSYRQETYRAVKLL